MLGRPVAAVVGEYRQEVPYLVAQVITVVQVPVLPMLAVVEVDRQELEVMPRLE